MQKFATEHRYELEAMDEFLTYDEKDLADDELSLMESIIKTCSKYLENEEIRKIQKAYIYSAEAHRGQKRLSGEDYITHPLKATQILLTIKPDCPTIQACILHDVIEDTPVTYDDIVREFGLEVATLCEGLVKVSKVRYQGEDTKLETLKKTFLAMANDLRVIFIKLADRIHNIQTLQFHPQENKKIKIAMETMKVYVPICKKLGLYQFQLYLENGAFKILHPEEYRQVITFLRKKYTQSDKYISKGIVRLGRLLQEGDMIEYTITGRVKSPYRIYEKLMKKYNNLDFSKVLDVIAFRIIAKSIPDCYNALGIIHAHFNPLINKIKDYISIPKANNYQSLHTTILGMYPFPVEIQIRTKSMNDIAEFGVAAHYAYKGEGDNNQSLTQRQSQWLSSLQDSVTTYQSENKKLQDRLSIELLDSNIFVYTPKGEVVELPKQSTVLDFAFRVHTDVGLRFNNATVNGVIKPIGHLLQSGDVIAVNTFKNRYTATKYRFDYLHMPSAKSKLMRFLKQQEKNIYVAQGTSILNNKLHKYSLPLINSDKDQVKKHYGEKLEQLLMQIASKAVSPMILLKEVYNFSNTTQKPKEGSKKVSLGSKQPKIIIDDQPFLSYELCSLCNPKPGEKIIARSGRDGIKIHTMQCKALSTVMYDKLIKASWNNELPGLGDSLLSAEKEHDIKSKNTATKQSHKHNKELLPLEHEKLEETDYHFLLTLIIPNQGSNLISLMMAFQELGVQIDSVKIDKIPDEGNYKISVESSYQNPSKIAYILRYLEKHYPHILSMTKQLS